jgi:esterase
MLVFLHGGGLNAHTWDVVCDLLCDRFRCVAIDLRGHGDSDWHDQGTYTLQAYVADLRAALDALRPGDVSLVGMSLGGLVALAYAATEQPVPQSLVMVDTGPDGSRSSGRERLHAFLDGPREYASIDDVIDRALRYNPRRNRERLRRTLQNNLRQTLHGTWTWKYDPRFRSASADPSMSREEIERRWDERRRILWAAAKAVSCPTLVVRGAESDMFLDDDAARTAAAFQAGSWIRIEGASHTVQSDQPQALAAAIDAFIAAADRAPDNRV